MARKKPQPAFSSTFLRMQEGLGLAFVGLAIYLVVSFLTFSLADPSFNNATPTGRVFNWGGTVGAYIADVTLLYFGLSAFLFALFPAVYGVSLLRHKPLDLMPLRLSALPGVLCFGGVLLHMLAFIPTWPIPEIGNGGLVGRLFYMMLQPYLGTFGTTMVCTLVGFLCLLWMTGWTVRNVITFSRYCWYMTCLMWDVAVKIVQRFQFKQPEQFDLPLDRPAPKPTRTPVEVQRKAPPKNTNRAETERQSSLPLMLEGSYELPPLSLLQAAPADDTPPDEAALTQNARQLEVQLKHFGVDGKITRIRPGPVITIYELEPAAGVKTAQVVGLADDLARAMSAIAVRVAPIPGKTVIGIEMPNSKRRTVYLRELLETEAFETHPAKLAIAMGVDTGGTPVYADISKMPHALVAGTTGSGKSVMINSMILSLAYRASPAQVRFLMVDPKMLELSIYNDIPHLLAPVVTDPNKAAVALKWVVKEMENRYRMMSEVGVKNIQSFNTQFAEWQAKGTIPKRKVQTGFDLQTGQPTFEERPLAEAAFPYIVVVIDELADLMMVAGKQVELYIARLAQMARAAGIHLVVATQRPSVDVVTGLIKANIPTRISFQVASRIDSRTILDQQGAEQLLGRGDMLHLGNGSIGVTRLHGAFVSEEECQAIANHLKAQGRPSYVDDIFKDDGGDGSLGGGSGEGGEGGDSDPLYQRAVEIVLRERKASTSYIQRNLQIGFNRAARMVDKMESEGLISAPDHVGKREVIARQSP